MKQAWYGRLLDVVGSIGPWRVRPTREKADTTKEKRERETEGRADKGRSSIEPNSCHIIGNGIDNMVESIVNSFRDIFVVIMNKQTNGLLCAFLCIPWDSHFLVFLLRGLSL